MANSAMQLFQSRNDVILHQALYVAASLGIADMLERGVHATADLARELSVHEDALYRTLRALAGQGIFEETLPRTFRNTPLSRPLRSDVSDTVRPLLIYFGSDFSLAISARALLSKTVISSRKFLLAAALIS
jgi:hypothetical protein